MQPNTWRICPSQFAKEWFSHLHFREINLQGGKYLEIFRKLLRSNNSLFHMCYDKAKIIIIISNYYIWFELCFFISDIW
jgi:hypothetical protein